MPLQTMRPRDQAAPDDSVGLARQALESGQQALMAGDGAAAISWLDRAHRLAPHDGTLTLTLATACLRRDNARAEALFRLVAEAEDVRSAWLGLAAARLEQGDAAGAASALAEALARHVPEPALLAGPASLADTIVRSAAATGWCGMTADGRLVIRPAMPGEAEIRLDGKRCAGPRLPRAWTSGCGTLGHNGRAATSSEARSGSPRSAVFPASSRRMTAASADGPGTPAIRTPIRSC